MHPHGQSHTSWMRSVFRDEVRGLIERGIHNIYVFGTAGEGYAVSDEQFETVVRVFADEMKRPGFIPPWSD